MDLTYQSILCKLPMETADLSDGGNCMINNIEPFDVSLAPNAGTLYLAPLETALAAPEGQALSFLCPEPEGGIPASVAARRRFAVAKGYRNIRVLAAIAFDTFHRLWRWRLELQQSVLDQEGAQALIDRSEEVLDDSILLLDLGHRLLAYSHNRPPRPGDTVHRYLVENGRHSEETISFMRESARLQEADTDGGDIIVSQDRRVSDSVTIKRYFRHDGRVYFGALLLCGYAPYSPGLADLFRIFCFYLEYYARKGYPYDHKYTAFDELLQVLLDESEDAAGKERRSLCANRCELSMSGLFDLYRIELREDSAQSPIHILLNLSETLRDVRITAQRSTIVILNIYAPEEDPEQRLAENRASILRLAGESVAAAGVSNPFTELWELRRAYVQAGAALEVIRAYQLHTEDGPAMLRFEDCYMGHLVYSAVREDDWLYENCHTRMLARRIREYDEANGTSYTQILRAFLLNERRPTETGQALGLHRNTIIYHIARMTELFKLELSDPETRVKLLLSLNRSCLEHSGGAVGRK